MRVYVLGVFEREKNERGRAKKGARRGEKSKTKERKGKKDKDKEDDAGRSS